MLVLVHASPTTLERAFGRHPNLGVLSCPQRIYSNIDGWPWAADNRAYVDWDETAYLAMLTRIADFSACLFVVAPDVVGDAQATDRRWHTWRPRIKNVLDHPLAYVAQDGCLSPPWDELDALFIGGTTLFKMNDVSNLIAEAKRRGKWVHMGRVNTARRLIYAQSVGCDSVDGSSFSAFRDQKLPWALKICAGGEQLALGGEQ